MQLRQGFGVKIAVVVALCSNFFLYASAHSSLTLPEPYTRKLCKEKSCRACPEFPPDRWRMPNDIDRPEVTWQRGQEVQIKWAKNNHDGGMVRLGVVPVDKMFDFDAHDQFAIFYGCWEQGLRRCERRTDNCQVNCREFDCAADKRNRVYSRNITIPKVIPDGIYALSYIWYGGIFYKRDFGKFSDYESCSFVEIKGGPFASSYQPFFDAGENKLFPKTPDGKCLTSATRPIECKTGCDNVRAFYDIPEPFRSGREPAPITPESYGGSFTSTPQPSRISTPTPTATATATASVAATVTSTPSKSLTPVGSTPTADRICRSRICCPLACGNDCATRACWLSAAGPQNCCKVAIRRSKRKCGRDAPPCQLRREKVFSRTVERA